LQQQETLIQLKTNLATIFNEKEIGQLVLQELHTSFNYPLSEIYLTDKHSGRLVRIIDPDTHSSIQQIKPGEGNALHSSDKSPGGNQTISGSNQQAREQQIITLIKFGDQTYGKMIVEFSTATEITDTDSSIIQKIAEATALSITNARNFEEQRAKKTEAEEREAKLRTRERTLTLLTEMTRATMKSQGLQALLQTLADHLGRLFQADSSLITLWDEARQQPVPVAAFGPLRQVIRTLQIEPGDLPLTASVLDTGQVLEVDDTRDTPFVSPRISAILQSRSLFAIPLIVDNQKLGAAILTYRNAHTFTGHETSLSNQAGGLIALAIAKARALEISQHRAQELAALQSATAALLTTLDLEKLLGQILDAAISAIPAAEKGRLLLIARDTGQLQIRAVQGYTDPRISTFRPTEISSYAARAVRERRPLIIHDAHADPDSPYQDDIPEVRAIASMIIAPLNIGEENLGAISLDAYTRYAFTRSDLHLLVSFAATATTAIQNAQLHSEVQKQAITDALTGLYNRRGFLELGWREVERAHRFERPLSALMLDIDFFKDVNDSHGHLIGDQVLAGIATQFLRDLRQIDLIGRYGGDEFIALLPETDLENACQAGERLRQVVHESIFAKDTQPVRITISVGVAAMHHEGENIESLIERADQALYQAKESGRNRVKSII
jgi:diguanylate cyclase (GGDEF)-like protein